MNADADEQRTGAIILAAGAATRMGRLKQLLPFRGRTLVQHAVEQATEAKFSPVIVVVGADAPKVCAAIANRTVKTAFNPDWHSGMGSSIACGLRALLDKAPDIHAVAILVADQPLVTTRHLTEMRNLLSVEFAAAAAEYGGSLGVPALFDRKLFPALAALPAEAGAKQLLRTLSNQVLAFPLPEAAVDIDAPEDYARVTA